MENIILSLRNSYELACLMLGYLCNTINGSILGTKIGHLSCEIVPHTLLPVTTWELHGPEALPE